MSEWILVADPPRRGLHVLAFYLNALGNARTVRAVLIGNKEMVADENAPDEWWDEDEGEYYAPAGWYEAPDNGESCWPIQPSHWMPLPEPPVPA